MLMCVSGLNQLDVRRTTWIGRSPGYSRARIWIRLILPRLYPQLRLPVHAVLAYSLSVVDVALILGPSVPPTLSVLINRWFNDPEVAYRMISSAGATWLFTVVVLSICGVLLECFIVRLSASRLVDESRSTILENLRWAGGGAALVMLIVSLLSLLVLIIWSVTRVWRFQDSLPSAYTLKCWFKGISLVSDPLITTLIVGGLTTIVAVITGGRLPGI